MEQLLILCCFGGIPFIQFPSSLAPTQAGGSQIRHQWDPTDWIATDLSGSLLNASAGSDLLSANPAMKSLIPPDLPADLSLEQCDLWNLTFASGADEHMFRRSRGQLKCRCSPELSGSACQRQKHQQQQQHQTNGVDGSSSSRPTTTTTTAASIIRAPPPTVAKPKKIQSSPSRPPAFTALPVAAASASASSLLPLPSSSRQVAAAPRPPNSKRFQRTMYTATAAPPTSSVAFPSLLLASSSPLSTAADDDSSLAVGLSRHENSFAVFLLLFMLLAGAMVALFGMLRGCCFCDCFGGFSGRSAGRRYEQPLDPQTVNRCLDAVHTYEQNEKNKWAAHGQWTVAPPPPPSASQLPMVVDSRRPLLSQPVGSTVPSVSESVPMVPAPRACSPPPSYRSMNASLEQLPGAQNTRI